MNQQAYHSPDAPGIKVLATSRDEAACMIEREAAGRFNLPDDFAARIHIVNQQQRCACGEVALAGELAIENLFGITALRVQHTVSACRFEPSEHPTLTLGCGKASW